MSQGVERIPYNRAVRSLWFVLAAVLASTALGADASRSTDAVDSSGRKTGSVTVERAGEPWSGSGKTFAPFSVVIRSGAPSKAHFFGTIALDGGKAGDCTWFATVDPGATKRIEKPCKQRRAWSDFSITAKVDVPRPKGSPTPTPTPEPIVP